MAAYFVCAAIEFIGMNIYNGDKQGQFIKLPVYLKRRRIYR